MAGLPQKTPTCPWNISQVPPKIPIWKDFLHKQVVDGLGVCSFQGLLEFPLKHNNNGGFARFHPVVGGFQDLRTRKSVMERPAQSKFGTMSGRNPSHLLVRKLPQNHILLKHCKQNAFTQKNKILNKNHSLQFPTQKMVTITPRKLAYSLKIDGRKINFPLHIFPFQGKKCWFLEGHAVSSHFLGHALACQGCSEKRFLGNEKRRSQRRRFSRRAVHLNFVEFLPILLLWYVFLDRKLFLYILHTPSFYLYQVFFRKGSNCIHSF